MHRPARIFADARSRRTVAVVVVVLTICLVAVAAIFDQHAAWLADPLAVRSFVDGFGVLAPLAFVLMQAGQVVFAPIPGQILGFSSGWLFGAYWGTVYSLIGAVLGSYVALRLSRHWGRPFVERVIDARILDRFDEFSTHHGYLTLFVVFLIPGLPDDVICFVAGTTDLDIKRMTVVSLVGRVPGYFLTNLAGASVATADYGLAAVILVGMFSIAFVVYVRREELVARLFPPER
jgi:uncharacterized membrane protein YdjX (TVP38/TMEM64 family)